MNFTWVCSAVERMKKELMQCSKSHQRPKTKKIMDFKGDYEGKEEVERINLETNLVYKYFFIF